MYENLSKEQLIEYIKTLNNTKYQVYAELMKRSDFTCKHPYEERLIQSIDGRTKHYCKVCNKDL